MWQATSADIVIVAGDPDGDVGRFVSERFGPRGGICRSGPRKKPRARSQETFRNYYALPAVE